MNSIVSQAIESLRAIERWYPRLYAELARVREAAGKSELTQGDRADCAYAMREIAKHCDDLRKEAEKVRQLLDKVMCIVWTTECETCPETSRSIHGEVAVATPDVKMGVTLPTKNTDPEGYEALMKYLGFSDELITTDAIRTHWPGMLDYMTHLMAEGRPLPPGVRSENTYPIYTTKIRRKETQA